MCVFFTNGKAGNINYSNLVKPSQNRKKLWNYAEKVRKLSNWHLLMKNVCLKNLNISVTVIAAVTTVILSSQAKMKKRWLWKVRKLSNWYLLHEKFDLKDSGNFSYSNYSNPVKPSQTEKLWNDALKSTKIVKLIVCDEKILIEKFRKFQLQ